MKRRDVLAKMGALSVGMAAPSLAKGEVYHKPYQVQNRTINTDVLVVGGGTAGVIAAIQDFKVVWYESNSTNIFPNVDINGGVAVTFRDKQQVFEEIGLFSSYPEIGSILDKVIDEKFKPLSDWVYPTESYRFTDKLHSDFPNAEAKLSKGHLYDLTTNIFEKLDEVFFDYKPNDSNEYIQIIGRHDNSRLIK